MRPSKVLVVLAVIAGLTTSVATTPPKVAAQAGGDWIDTLDREAVLSAYSATFDPPLSDPGWDGNVGACRGGTLALGFRRSIQARINYFRRMAGVDGGVVEDSGFSVRAQEAALLMAANGTFNPNPPETWACWTEAGDDGAGRSLLSPLTGPGVIDAWVSDGSQTNLGVGHRSWILLPTQVRAGIGVVPGRASALYVDDPENQQPPGPPPIRDPAGFVSWPPAGFVPSPTVYGRWSLHHLDADFSAATVTVTVDGLRVAAPIAYRGPGFAMPTFSFVPQLPFLGRADREVRVTVANITLEGQTEPVTHTWTTTVIPPPLTPDERFIVQAHQHFLGRPPTDSERGLWAAFLAGRPARRASFVSSLAISPEWVGALVDRFYNDTLGRDGDPAGRAFWVGQIRTGRLTPAAVAAFFYASDEYFVRFGRSSLPTWVADLYLKLLGRAADPDGIAHWVGVAGRSGRRAVAANLYQSLESRLRRVERLYLDLLERPPDPSGHRYWAGVILQTGSDVALATNLASSAEYYRRAQQLS